MIVEWLLITIPLLGAGIILFRRGTAPQTRAWAGIFTIAGLLAVGCWQKYLDKKRESQAGLTAPHRGRPEAYSTSASCAACHPSQYSSWHRSFHRTMTQIASPEAVRGKFDDVTLELDGETYRLEHNGDEYWVEMNDPDWKMKEKPPAAAREKPPRVRRRITMVTGSHHMQAYWVDNLHGNQQYSFPFTYLFEQERWVPRRTAFIKDPNEHRWNQLWNVGCIECHATAGEPLQKKSVEDFDTRVAELGIACEACHGPGAEHVRLNSDPLRRYSLHFKIKGDASIVNPGRLSSKRSSEVCGSCHSIHFAADQDKWLQTGLNFHAGEVLETKARVPLLPKTPAIRHGAFWSDGMIRVSGREYNGLLKTACFQKGDMSCLSCHSMHESSPTNQLARGMESNMACVKCHQTIEKNITQHTHHPAESSGSLCYNCHMPYTTYGLLKALRSHQVSNPSVQASLQTGRPNACNLCHLDKTLDWTAKNLFTWYKTPEEGLSEQEKGLAASVLWALKGDAGQRALIAWHMGWKPAQEASGTSWMPPYLGTLLEDPYPAVRYIAGRSLQRLPGYDNFPYDYIAGPEVLHQSTRRAIENWMKMAPAKADVHLLMGKDGRLDIETAEGLLKSRNNRVVELNE